MPTPKKKGGAPPVEPPEVDVTSTGGNGDDDGDDGLPATPLIIQMGGPPPDEDMPILKRRKDLVTANTMTESRLPGFEWSFNPTSLMGSWFHRLENDDIVWQGVIVAEPQPGLYLCQIDKLDEGAENIQRLVPVTAMVSDDEGYDWRFYDNQAEAIKAFGAWIGAAPRRGGS